MRRCPVSDQRDGGIAWTDETWNPVRGCSEVSPGCKNCYARTQAARFSGPGLPYEGLVEIRPKKPGSRRSAHWTGRVNLAWKQMLEPLKWRKPKRAFVNSMSDLFHENLSDEDRDVVFSVILACQVLAYHDDCEIGRGHTFQILTKRPEVMRRYMGADPRELLRRWGKAGDGIITVGDGDTYFSEYAESHWEEAPERFAALPNTLLGVSVENQATADERIPILLETRATRRFVSYEPALGAVDFTTLWRRAGFRKPLTGEDVSVSPSGRVEQAHAEALDWIIVGGESGPGARRFELAWARSVIEQTRGTGCAVFVKQLGAKPIGNGNDLPIRRTLRGAPEPDVALALRDSKGGDMSEWPADLRVREWPGEVSHG